MKIGTRLLIAVALQSLVIIAMVGMKQYTLATGVPVILETRPIDPRSLFRGDYVALHYGITELLAENFEDAGELAVGDVVYVVLQNQLPHAIPVAISREWVEPEPGHVVIKGTVDDTTGETIHVHYGIESYFVPEGEGMALERPAPGETVTVQVAIDRFGSAGIKAILVNGEPRYTESLF